MKTTLCICRLFLTVLIAIAMVGFLGCGSDEGDDSDTGTYEEKLSGSYTLSSMEVDEDGVTVTLKPPNVSGRLVLNAGGSWSAALGIPHLRINETTSGKSWSATSSLIIYDDGTQDSYTLTGNTLVLRDESDGVKLVGTFKK